MIFKVSRCSDPEARCSLQGHRPNLRNRLLEIRRSYEQTIDTLSKERALGPESESMVKELWKQRQARDWSISSAVEEAW